MQARNDINVKDKTRIPDITCIINPVANGKFRSKIDLTDKYHILKIEQRVKNTTLSILHLELIEYESYNKEIVMHQLYLLI